jgi:pimeloyl-ACP methyl ester carboxylesterase
MTFEDAARQLQQIEAASRRAETPCGPGRMVWHLWGDGPPLVLLHGGAGSWRHWARNVVPLSRHRLVLAADLPGLGESELPPDARDFDTVAGIVTDGIDRLIGATSAYELAGFSYGSLVSGQVALRHRHRISRMILTGAGSLGTGRNPTPLEKVRSRTGADRLEAHRTNLLRLMIADPAKIDPFALTIQAWNSDHARLSERPPADSAPLRDALAQLSIPLRMIWGEQDATCVGEVLQQRRESVRRVRPDATIDIIPAAGHWAAFEAAEQWNDIFLG